MTTYTAEFANYEEFWNNEDEAEKWLITGDDKTIETTVSYDEDDSPEYLGEICWHSSVRQAFIAEFERLRNEEGEDPIYFDFKVK